MRKPVPRAHESVEQGPTVDLTKCYVCRNRATARCATCAIPVCDEHQRETRGCGYFGETLAIMCIECTVIMQNW